MSDYIVLKQIRLGPAHVRSGKTRHYLGGTELPPATFLRIVEYPGEEGVYLLYFDADDVEMTDTLHDTVEAALSQAEFEYGIQPHEWQTIHDNN